MVATTKAVAASLDSRLSALAATLSTHSSRETNLRRIADSIVSVKVSHACWAARRIARWLITEHRIQQQMTVEITAEAAKNGVRRYEVTLRDLADLVACDAFTQRRLGLYFVNPALIPFAAKRAMELVERYKSLGARMPKSRGRGW